MIFTPANDQFIVWPSSVTLTFNSPEQMFQINDLNLPEQMFQINKYAELFWNPCINVGLWPGQAQFMTFWSFDL